MVIRCKHSVLNLCRRMNSISILTPRTFRLRTDTLHKLGNSFHIRCFWLKIRREYRPSDGIDLFWNKYRPARSSHRRSNSKQVCKQHHRIPLDLQSHARRSSAMLKSSMISQKTRSNKFIFDEKHSPNITEVVVLKINFAPSRKYLKYG